MAKFSKSSAADVPFMSKRKRQNDFFGVLIQFGHLVVLTHESNDGPGGGETRIWNRRGCSSEILNLTPKGDHLGVA